MVSSRNAIIGWFLSLVSCVVDVDVLLIGCCCYFCSGLFSGPGYDRIEKSSLERVVVCNTVPLQKEGPKNKITQISIANLLAEAIARIHLKKSVSELFAKAD